MRKTLSKLGRILALPLVVGMAGCAPDRDNSNDFSKLGTYEGYTVNASMTLEGKKLSIIDANYNEGFWGGSPYLFALDDGGFDSETGEKTFYPDGRFDNIDFRSIPKGHPLEQYISLDKLEEIWQHVKETGEDFR